MSQMYSMLSVLYGLKRFFRPPFCAVIPTLCIVITVSFTAVQTAHAEPPLPPAEENSSWTLALDRNGIQIYTQEWPDSRFPAVKTVQVVSTTLANAVSHFFNTEAYPEWASDMHEARVLVPVNEEMERLIYMHMDLPWPLQDRDSVARQRVTQDMETLAVLFKERDANDQLAARPNITRLPKLNAELILIPISADKTKIIWQGHNEPGGYLPAFVFRWMLEHILYESSLNMRKRLATPSMAKSATWVVSPE
jgi:hypothetical protein